VEIETPAALATSLIVAELLMLNSLAIINSECYCGF